MRQVHHAGEKLFLDYAGPTGALMAHGQEAGRADTFVAAPCDKGRALRAATHRQHAGLCALLQLQCAPDTRLLPAGQTGGCGRRLNLDPMSLAPGQLILNTFPMVVSKCVCFDHRL